MPHKFAIIAGGGEAPKRLLAACQKFTEAPFVVAVVGQTDPACTEGVEHLWVKMGEAAHLRDGLRAAGVDAVTFIGRIRRPSLQELKPDALLIKKLPLLGLGAARGDDGLLRGVAKAFEEEGFRLIAPQEIFSELLAPSGILGRHVPDGVAEKDIAHAFAVARQLGLADVGQAVVVQQGVVIAVEAIEGTDQMLSRVRELQRLGKGGVLVKCRKPQQDIRFDLPALGPETVRRAVAAGLRGIAYVGGETLLIDRDASVAIADQEGLFLIGREGNDVPAG